MTSRAQEGEKSARGAKPEGFFQRIFSIFAGIGDPEAEKKKFLRSLAKELTRSRYKFYRPKGQEALPGLAKFFYEIYKLAAPAQLLLGNSAASGALRSFVIESYLSRRAARALGAPDRGLYRRARQDPLPRPGPGGDQARPHLLLRRLRRREEQADRRRLQHAPRLHQLRQLRLLLPPQEIRLGPPRAQLLATSPSSSPSTASTSSTTSRTSSRSSAPSTSRRDWALIFGALKDYKKIDIVPIEAWTKFVAAASELRKSVVLDQIVRHLKEDPFWDRKPRVPERAHRRALPPEAQDPDRDRHPAHHPGAAQLQDRRDRQPDLRHVRHPADEELHREGQRGLREEDARRLHAGPGHELPQGLPDGLLQEGHPRARRPPHHQGPVDRQPPVPAALRLLPRHHRRLGARSSSSTRSSPTRASSARACARPSPRPTATRTR